jgi:hypothetical protein
MMKCAVFAAFCSIGATANDVIAEGDVGLSLLQTRAIFRDDVSKVDTLTQGPFKKQSQDCADDELLSLDQCTEAYLSREFGNDPEDHWQIRGPLTHADGFGPEGCFIAPWMGKMAIRWNPGRLDGRKGFQPNRNPICSADGNGARSQEPGVGEPLPAAGVEALPVNSQCECGVLSFDQCALWMQANRANGGRGGSPLSATQFNPPGGRSRFGEGEPYISSNRQAARLGGVGPRGCYRGFTEVYYNPDDGDEPQSGHVDREPICPVCPTTTTTTTTTIAPGEPGEDDAEATGDPHIRTNMGKHFDYSS